MNKKEKDIKFIKKGKLIAMIFGLLSIMNIIILIGRNSSYALFRRNVQSKRVIEIHTAKEFPSKVGLDVLKKKLGTGGLVGIPTSCSEESCTPITDKNADKSTIREYRYSGLGVNNYVYFNCKEGVEQNADNCETWRIIGIFKDDVGQEHIKIVRNETIAKDNIPLEYTVGSKTYKISYSSLHDYSYWDYDGTNYDNNWADAGLMYWLNSKGTTDGYLKKLTDEAQNMIANTKYYLGSITYNSGINDTTIETYQYERAVTGCSDNKGPSTNSSKSVVEGNSTCRVWANNVATWTGKIALIYPSDYGFSTDSSYWNVTKLNNYNETVKDTSWLQLEANHNWWEWLLSPTTYGADSISAWGSDNLVKGSSGNIVNVLAYYYYPFRPTLYLKSDIEIMGGNGTLEKPYQLSGN